MQTVQAGDQSFRLMIPAADIQQQVAALGRQLSEDFAGKELLILTVLNGAFMFAADLARQVTVPVTFSFIRLVSYDGLATSGNVRVAAGLQDDIRDKHVLLLEDIIDTGTTLHYFLPELLRRDPASLHTVTCFIKPEALLFDDARADYYCFSLPQKFVLGYGMDYNGYGRNYPDLYELIPA